MSSCEIIEGITLHHGDCREIMRTLAADHFDAIITDPPYGIAFQGEKWDTSGAATHFSSHKTNTSGEPVTDEAKAWAGWGVGLKPAWEPIVVARRPLEGRLIDNARAYGTGAMNIQSGMTAAGGSYPPNLMVSEAALAAAVDQGAPDHVWPVFRYQPKAPTCERPKVGGYST